MASFRTTISLFKKILAKFAPSKQRVERLLKNIGIMFLMVCVLSWVNKQEETASQEVMPDEPHTCIVSANQPTDYCGNPNLNTGCWIMPIYATSELPGYHPHHSKPKCLHTADSLKRRISSLADIRSSVHLNTHLYIHTKDYYVFTLEHILI